MELDQKSPPAGSCSTGKGACGCSTPKKTSPATVAPAPVAEAPDKRTFVPGENRRKSNVDRRCGMERRQLSLDASDYDGPERRSGIERRIDTGLERRRGPGRRRADDRREAEEGEMNVEQFEFIKAIETYKKVNKRLYPTWTEILEIVRQLGYRKVLPRDIHLENVPEPVLSKVA